MLCVRTLRDGSLVQENIGLAAEFPEDVLWVDLFRPTPEESRTVTEHFGVSVPPPESLVEIEATSRLFENEEGLHFRSYFLQELAEGG